VWTNLKHPASSKKETEEEAAKIGGIGRKGEIKKGAKRNESLQGQ
jgi:hypothetical protein